FALTILILFAYVLLWWAARYRLSDSAQSATNQAAEKKSMKVMRYIQLQLIAHCLFVVSSRTMLFISEMVEKSSSIEQRLNAYYGEVNSFDLMINAVVFYWRHPK